MKKMFVGILIGILISGVCFASSNGLFEGFEIAKVNVDGKEISGDVPAVVLNNRTMVPVRFVSEALGGDIQWDGETNTVNITPLTSLGEMIYYNAKLGVYREINSVLNIHNLIIGMATNNNIEIKKDRIEQYINSLNGKKEYLNQYYIKAVFSDDYLLDFNKALDAYIEACNCLKYGNRIDAGKNTLNATEMIEKYRRDCFKDSVDFETKMTERLTNILSKQK